MDDNTPPPSAGLVKYRYRRQELLRLKSSPLVVKPPGLPPAEQWMGPAADTIHQPRPARPVAERHVSRNSANPEDIVLGPPKTNFMSATSIRTTSKNFDSIERPSPRDSDSRDRFNFRSKATELENERRGNRNDTLRPKRADGEDSDGWSTVKPRKSFGTEGAERFTGRMGVRFKEERDVKDRPRTFDRFARDKEGDQEQEQDSRRNGSGRGRNEPSWFRDRDNDGPPTPRERNNGDRTADRSRGWREKEREDRGGDRGGDRGDRRWDRDNRGDRGDNRGDNRDHHQEREPEWMDDPVPEKDKKHTQDDFQKWKESMAAKDKPTKPAEEEAPQENGSSFFNLEKPKVETPLEIETGPDKFFGMWAPQQQKEDLRTPDSAIESRKEGMSKSKTTVGKASRFTSFFSTVEEPVRRQTEPAQTMPQPQAQLGGLASLFQPPSNPSQTPSTSDAQEKEAFQALLAKLTLQKSGGSGSTPPVNSAQQPKSPPEKLPSMKDEISHPEPYPQYRLERQRPDIQEDARSNIRSSQQQQQQQLQQQAAIQEILNQRQISNSQPTVRPEQMLQDLVGQRQNALSQASARQEQQQALNRNTNTEFLMGLMQSAKAAPEPQRTEQLLLRMPPKMIPMDRQLQQQQQQQLLMEREQEMHREAQAAAQAAHRERATSASQRQQARPPPGFYEDPSAFQRGPPQHDRQSNPPQPTQILQRPPPPGLDMGWDRQAQITLQNRIAQSIAPPPGLNGGLNGGPGRGGIPGMPMNQQMFPPGFMGNFPPPEMLVGPGGPRGVQQMQPPPGFFNGPPPGFLPPGMGGFNGGPEGMAFPGFDGRGQGVPPNGGYRRQ